MSQKSRSQIYTYILFVAVILLITPAIIIYRSKTCFLGRCVNTPLTTKTLEENAKLGWYNFEKIEHGDETIKTRQLEVIGKPSLGPDTAIKSQKRAIDSLLINVKEYVSLVKIWESLLLLELGELRAYFSRVLLIYIPSPHGNLVESMVFGGAKKVDKSLNHSFKVIGMQHVMAASGFNVSLIFALVWPILKNGFSQRLSSMASLLMVWLYVALTGFPASVVRAGVMLTFAIVTAKLLRRQSRAWWVLLLTVIVMVLLNRQYLSDIGFQLSVSSTAGLILVTPLLSTNSWWQKTEVGVSDVFATELQKNQSLWSRIWAFFKEPAFTTIAAQAFSLPLLLHYFGELSLLSLLANTLLLWLTPLITIGGVMVLIVGSVGSSIGSGFEIIPQIGGWAVWIVSDVFVKGVSFLGRYDSTLLKMPLLSEKWVILWWLGVLALVWKAKNNDKTSVTT